jgi:hypothetical protein
MLNLPHTSRTGVALCLTLALLLAASSARAQTGAPLLVKPWPDKDQLFEGRAEGLFFNAGHDKSSDMRYQLDMYDSVGRFRILPGNEISPRVGYDFMRLDFHGHDVRIPNRLSDESIALGTGVYKGNGWLAGITVGAGYAGNNEFGEGRAWYGKADLVIAKEINETDALGIIIDYDGHRTYAPDLPLPGFGYSHRFDPKLSVVAGLPYSSLSWKPIDRLDIELEYFLLTDFRANIGYEFIPHWTVYGAVTTTQDTFEVAGLPPNRRLLYQQRRAEAGLRFSPNDRLSFSAGIGYGWGTKLKTGFDFRSTAGLIDLSDAPYARAALEFRY